MRIVLDTNILISSIIESRGPSARLVDAWLDEEAFILVTSTKQLEELLRVMGYDRLRKRIDESRSETLIDGLLHVATVVETLPEVDLSPDPDDNAIIATALAGQADLIVTGDKRDLLSLKHIETEGRSSGARTSEGAGSSSRGGSEVSRVSGVPIITARQALERLGRTS